MTYRLVGGRRVGGLWDEVGGMSGSARTERTAGESEPEAGRSREVRGAGTGRRIGRRSRFCWPVVTIPVVVVYVFGLMVVTPKWLGRFYPPQVGAVRGAVQRLCGWVLVGLGDAEPSVFARHGAFLVLLGIVVPWVVMGVLGRGRPRDLGLRLPNRIGWRILVVGYVVALPFQVWLASNGALASVYLKQFEDAGGAVYCVYYAVNMGAEHFFFHGVLLAAFRTDLRWPAAAEGVSASDGGGGVLRWLGLNQPMSGATGLVRWTRWVGLADGCVTAVAVSGLLFGAVHLGKNVHELALSVPGGMALAYLAYRTNSAVVPLMLHLATAASAFGLMLVWQGG